MSDWGKESRELVKRKEAQVLRSRKIRSEAKEWIRTRSRQRVGRCFFMGWNHHENHERR